MGNVSRLALVTFHTRAGQHGPALRLLELIGHEAGWEVRRFEAGPPAKPESCAAAVAAWVPDLVGLSLYIWNRQWSREFLAALRKTRRCPVIVGGPEATGDPEGVAAELAADWTVAGEGEEIFRRILAGESVPAGIIQTQPVDFTSVPEIELRGQGILPVENPTVYHEPGLPFLYYESSRGCPGACTYCLSGLGIPFRTKNLERIRRELSALAAAGFRGDLRFLDRTANHPPGRLAAILTMIADEKFPFSLLQFELDPGRLQPEDRDALVAFRHCPLQLEAGVQSLQPDELAAVRRPADPERVLATLADLIGHGIAVHVDLIAGLPRQTPASLAISFDRLHALHPASLQCWILKVLPGTTLAGRGKMGPCPAARQRSENPAPPLSLHAGFSTPRVKPPVSLWPGKSIVPAPDDGSHCVGNFPRSGKEPARNHGVWGRWPQRGVGQSPTLLYLPHPPYTVIETDGFTADELERVGALAALYNRVWNAGRFRESFRRLVVGQGSAFAVLWAMADGLTGEAAATGLTPAQVAGRMGEAAQGDPAVLSALAHELRLTQGKRQRCNPFDRAAGIKAEVDGDGTERVMYRRSPLPPPGHGRPYSCPSPQVLLYAWRRRMTGKPDWWTVLR